MKRLVLIAAICVSTAAFAKEPEQTEPQDAPANQPIGGGKPVKTVPIRPCPEGYEPVILTNRGDQRACAKDIVPIKE